MRIPLEMLARSPLWAVRSELANLMMFQLLNETPEPEAHTWEAAQPSSRANGSGKIAIVPIQGILTKDGPAWLGSNYEGISRAVENAASDPEVQRIVLVVDSPGGDVLGCPETGAVIAKAATTKPVSAIVDGQSASAAYWLTSQASDITVTPSGEVGSVGIKMLHADISKKMEMQGITVTELSSGTNKTDWSPYKSLSVDAKAEMQTRMDGMHSDFLNAISASRGDRASQDIQAARFGEGRMFLAKDAKTHGLVDAVLSTREFFKSLAPAAERQTVPPLRARLEIDKALAESGF